MSIISLPQTSIFPQPRPPQTLGSLPDYWRTIAFHKLAEARQFTGLSQREFDQLAIAGAAFLVGVLLLIIILRVAASVRRSKKQSVIVTFPDRPCRWRQDSFRRGTRLRRWVCLSCGVDAFTMEKNPPHECKKLLRQYTL